MSSVGQMKAAHAKRAREEMDTLKKEVREIEQEILEFEEILATGLATNPILSSLLFVQDP